MRCTVAATGTGAQIFVSVAHSKAGNRRTRGGACYRSTNRQGSQSLMPECMVESGITRRPPLRLQLDLPLLLGLLLLLSPPSSGAYNTSVLQVRGGICLWVVTGSPLAYKRGGMKLVEALSSAMGEEHLTRRHILGHAGGVSRLARGGLHEHLAAKGRRQSRCMDGAAVFSATTARAAAAAAGG